MTEAGSLQVAQGYLPVGGQLEYKEEWRISRKALGKPPRVEVDNRLAHPIKVLYYNAGDTVMLVAAGHIVVPARSKKKLPSAAHRIKVFKPQLFDKHLTTSGVVRGKVVVKWYGNQIEARGQKLSAPAMRFVNRSSEQVKVCVYDKGDVLQAIPKHISWVNAGQTKSWPIHHGRHRVKMFRPQFLDAILVEGEFAYNSELTIHHSYFADTGITFTPGTEIGASLYSDNNSGVDGAATTASKHLFAFDRSKLVIARQDARAAFPFRFIQGASFGWGETIRPPIAIPTLVGAPAVVAFDENTSVAVDAPRMQSLVFAVTDSGKILSRKLYRWEEFYSLEEWNEGGTWVERLAGGATHVGAGVRMPHLNEVAYVVHRKEDGTLHGAKYRSANSFGSWGPLSTEAFQGGPAVYYHHRAAHPGHPEVETITVFGVTNAGVLKERQYVTGSGWGAWTPIRNGCAGTPDIHVRDSRVYLAVRLAGGQVAVNTKTSEGWQAWKVIPGAIASSPVIYTLP